MPHLATTRGNGKADYDWRDIHAVPLRTPEEEAKTKARKAAREALAVKLDQEFASLSAEEIAAREMPSFNDDVLCSYCKEPWQRCICRMPDEEQADHIARVTKETGQAAVTSGGKTYLVKDLHIPDNKVLPFKRPHASNEIGLARLADVAMKPVDWLWSNHLARGKLTMLSGPSELGKSTVSIDLAARLSQGSKWPDDNPAPLGSTIILSSEDAVADTIAPRATAAGANLENIYSLAFVKTDGVSRTFSLQSDLQRLGEKIRAIGNVHLVIIDPVTSYMGTKIDSHRTTDVRGVLEPLQKFAEDYNVAVLMISHPQKAPATKSLNAVTGSAAFVHTPRMHFLCIQDPECKDKINSRVLFLAGKNNLGKKAAGIGYKTVNVFVGPDECIATSRIEWDNLPVTITANEALEAEAENRRGSSTQEAKEFLETRLADGPQSVKDIEAEAEANGISERTLNRARKKMGLKARKDKGRFKGRRFLDRGFTVIKGGKDKKSGKDDEGCH
jgi:RecA-family ATPase